MLRIRFLLDRLRVSCGVRRSTEFYRGSVNAFLMLAIAVGLGTGAGVYALTMRDLVRRGRLHRQKEQLLFKGQPLTLPDGRVPCPECAEAILPQARKCPYCRSVVVGRV
jgi:hypothetical protein